MAGMAALFVVGFVSSASAAPTSWSAPAAFDFGSFPLSGALQGVSCTSSTLCVAVDQAGDILTSTNPAATTPTWTASAVAAHTGGLKAVSCASASLCVAAGKDGTLYTATSPTGGAGAWTAHTIDGTAALNAVSCPSASLCVAVDNAGNALAATSPTTTGSWVKTGIETSGLKQLTGISCPSITFCVVVDGSGQALVSTNPGGGSWSLPATIDTAEAPGNIIHGISCVSTTLCVAVDNAGNAITSTNPAAATPTWTMANVDGTASINAVSCSSSSLCVAVDGSGNALSATNPSAGPWSKATGADGSHILKGISCPADNLCVAVDMQANAVASTHPTISSDWMVTAADSGTVSASNGPTGVSCPTAGLCVAVDAQGNAVRSTNPAGGTWTQSNAGGGSLLAVSCPSTTFCVAGDDSGDILYLSSGTWHVLPNVDGTESIYSVSCPTTSLNDIDGTESLYGISCVSSDLCFAVDDLGNVLWSTTPAAGDAWTPISIDSGHVLNAISCPSSSLCVATDDAGNVIASVTPTAATWDTPTNIDGSEPIYAISCATGSTTCVAADGAGDVLTSTSPTGPAAAWSAANVDGGDQFTGISCPTVSVCIAVDSEGYMVAGSTTSPSPPTVSTGSASSIGASSATVAGTVDPNGLNVSDCHFAYGTSALDMSSQAPCASSPGSGTSDVQVSAQLSGLTPGTTYDYEIVATNSAGTSSGSVNSFTTSTSGGPSTETLTVSKLGAGNGEVTSSPAGIDCGATCLHAFSSGKQVTLTAAASAGSTFAGWAGACSGTGTCNLTMSTARSVTATFKPKPVARCVVPKLKGKTLAAAKSALKKAHCALGKVTRKRSSVRKGRVISSKPARGTKRPHGSKVALVLSSGKRR